jgi:hypothetical protein
MVVRAGLGSTGVILRDAVFNGENRRHGDSHTPGGSSSSGGCPGVQAATASAPRACRETSLSFNIPTEWQPKMPRPGLCENQVLKIL